jgi:hypothetical protein
MMTAHMVTDTIERQLNEAATHLRNAARAVREIETFPSSDLQRICAAEVQVSSGLAALQNAIDDFKGGR